MGLLPLSKINIYRHPTDLSFDNFNADTRALFFDNRLAVSSNLTCFVRCRLSQRFLYLKIYGIDARVFSNTLDGDYNSTLVSSPSDMLATRGP